MSKIQAVKNKKDFAENWLWEQSQEIKNPMGKALVGTLRIIYLLGKDLAEGQLSLRAMSLVYTSIISLVPLLALSFSVLKGFGAHESLRPMIEGMVAPIGADGPKIADQIIGFVDNIQIGVLGAVGLALLIFSVVSMMQKIERSFNYIWHIQKERSFGQRFNDYLSMLLVGPLLLFLSGAITSGAKMDQVNTTLLSIPGGEYLVTLIGVVIPYLIMALGFTFIYAHMPNTKVQLKAAFIGGLATAVVWKSLGFLFTLFVASGDSNTAIYATFASIIVLMIWLYVAWLILLVGASIAFYVQHPFSTPFIRNHDVRLSSRLKEQLGLDMMMRIARAFKKGQDGPTTNCLIREIGMPPEVIRQMADGLYAAKLIVFSEEKKTRRYLPARALEHITVQQVLDCLRFEGELDKVGKSYLPATNKVLTEYDKLHNKGIGSKHLSELV